MLSTKTYGHESFLPANRVIHLKMHQETGTELMIASRVMLLAVSITLFIGVWSSDQKQPRTGYLAELAQRNGQDSHAVVSHGSSQSQIVVANDDDFVLKSESSDTVKESVAMNGANEPRDADASQLRADNSVSIGESGIRLPEGIAPGDYRVVTSDGLVGNLTLTASDLVFNGIRSGSVPQELYTVRERDRRSYFIRLDTRLKLTKAGAK